MGPSGPDVCTIAPPPIHPPALGVPQFPLFLSMRWWSCVVSCFRLLFIFFHFLLQNWRLLKFGSLCIRVKSRKLVEMFVISHLATFYWFLAVHRETRALLYFLSLDLRALYNQKPMFFSRLSETWCIFARGRHIWGFWAHLWLFF